MIWEPMNHNPPNMDHSLRLLLLTILDIGQMEVAKIGIQKFKKKIWNTRIVKQFIVIETINNIIFIINNSLLI